MNKFDAEISRINLAETVDGENQTTLESIVDQMKENDVEIDGEIVDAYYIGSEDTLILFIEKNGSIERLTTWVGHGG